MIRHRKSKNSSIICFTGTNTSGRMKANAVNNLQLEQVTPNVNFLLIIWFLNRSKGPQTWSKIFEGARGKHQSPINIESSLAKYEPSLNTFPLSISYDDDSCFQIKNTGHTFQVDGFQKNASSNHDELNFLIVYYQQLRFFI